MFQNILFCTDFSEDSHWAFTYALDLAKTYKANLLIFHVTPEPVHPEQLSLYLAPKKLDALRLCQKKEMDRQVRTHYVEKMGRFKNYKIVFKEGEPFIEIIQRAKKDSVDLIVMGTHGRTGLDHVLFGSTAEKVVRKSPCPVLTVRLPGRRFSMP